MNRSEDHPAFYKCRAISTSSPPAVSDSLDQGYRYISVGNQILSGSDLAPKIPSPSVDRTSAP